MRRNHVWKKDAASFELELLTILLPPQHLLLMMYLVKSVTRSSKCLIRPVCGSFRSNSRNVDPKITDVDPLKKKERREYFEDNESELFEKAYPQVIHAIKPFYDIDQTSKVLADMEQVS